MSGDPSQVHAAGAVLDKEQHVQAAQEYGVDVEEVRGQDRLCLGSQESPPSLTGSLRRRVDARVLEDLPHRRRRQLVAQTGQFAMDAPVAPARVVPRHLQHQRTDRLRRTRPSRSVAWIRPAALD
jgi:hypothetical protein